MAMLTKWVPVAGSIFFLAAASILLLPGSVAAEDDADRQDAAEATTQDETSGDVYEFEPSIDDLEIDDSESSANTPDESGVEEMVIEPKADGSSNEEDYDDLAPILIGSEVDPDMEEIFVMANKRAENLQQVAISVTALDGEFLEKAGVTDFSDIQKFVSNLSIEGGTDTRSTSVRIRGIGSVGTNAGIDPSVGLFIDGVYQGRAGMSMGDLIDISAVEVLRGPQGTLYGKNTAAGLISVRTMRPEYEFNSMVQIGAGSEDSFSARSSINIPIVDERIATRIAAYRTLRDGWDTNLFDGNDVNDADKWGVRNKWLFDINDGVSLLISGDYAKEDSSCCVPDIITYEGDSLLWRGTRPITGDGSGDDPNSNPNWEKLAGFFNPGAPDPNIGNTVDPAKPELRNFRLYDGVVDVDRTPENEVQIWGVQADVDMAVGEWDVNWLTAFRAYDTDSQFDGDFSQFNAVVSDTKEDLEQVSTELRVQSPLGGFADFTTGLYFFWLDHKTVGHIGFDQDYADIFFILPFEPLINEDTSRHQTFSYAGYGQFNAHLSEYAKFTGGLRLSYEQKFIKGSQISTSNVPAPPVSGLDDFRDDSRDTTKISGTAKVQLFPTDDIMLYAGFASGFKSGGFNQLRTAQDVPFEFDDENALSYEVGMRSAWFDQMLTFNLTGFFTDYDDFQAQTFSGTSIAVLNAGSFHSYGFESDMIVAPIENLVWRTSLGFTYTEYQEFDAAENTVDNIVALGLTALNPVAPFTLSGALESAKNNPAILDLIAPVTTVAQDLSGERLDNSPRWDLNTSIDYSVPVLDFPFHWVFHGDYNFRSSIFLSQDLDRNLKEDPRHLLALRTGLRDENDVWELTVWMNNVLDEEYLVAGFDIPVLGGFAGLHGDPRHYGASVRLRF